jgi:hypothetical protein
MIKQDKGACGEHLAAAALLRNGYSVYWNTSFSGVSDLMAQKDGQIFRVQVKTFYDKRQVGRYRTEKSIYRVAEVRTSNTVNGEYHLSYVGLVDIIVLVDTDTGEVYLIPADLRTCQIAKDTISKYRIFPIPREV